MCDNPVDDSIFDRAIILTDVRITAYTTDALVAMQSGDSGAIGESIDISAANMYEIINVNIIPHKAASSFYINGPIVDAITAKYTTVCEACPTGYEFYLQYRPYVCGGVTSTEPVLLYSLDAGDTFYEISLAYIFDVIGLDCTASTTLLYAASIAFNGRDIIISTDNGQIILPILDVIYDGIEIAGVIVIGSYIVLDNDTYDAVSIVVGTNGGITRISNTDIFEYTAVTTDTLFSVSMLDENNFVAGGANGALVIGSGIGVDLYPIIVNGVTIIDDIYGVIYLTRNYIVVYTATAIYYTKDAGLTWYAGWSSSLEHVAKIVAVTASIWYMITNDTVKQMPFLYRTTDGGKKWTKMSFDVDAGTVLITIACDANEANYVVVGGYVPVVYPANPGNPLNTYDPTVADTGYIIHSTDRR